MAPRPAARPTTAPASRPAPRPAIAPRPARSPRDQPARARLISFLRSIPDHAFLDRLIRGRVWIPMLGVLLAGIVAMQVEVLKMSAGVGRSLAYSSQLQSQNEQLRASVAWLGDDQRIMRLAYGMGMVMPQSGMVGFLSAVPGGALGAAIGNIHAPDATTFLDSTPTYSTTNNGEVVTASSLAATLGTTTAGGVTTSPGATGSTGQSTSGLSSAGANTTQSPALAQSPQSASGTSGSAGGGSSTGGGSGTGGSGSTTGAGTASGGGTGTGTSAGGGTSTGTATGGGTPSGGGASLTGGSGIQPGGTQTTPSGG